MTQTNLQIEDIKKGDGQEVSGGDYITIHYNRRLHAVSLRDKGTLEDGHQFDSSYDRGQPFKTRIGVGQVIEGWDMGVMGMKVGGKRKLTIPSQLAYKDQEIGDIPPNSTLIFELELLSID